MTVLTINEQRKSEKLIESQLEASLDGGGFNYDDDDNNIGSENKISKVCLQHCQRVSGNRDKNHKNNLNNIKSDEGKCKEKLNDDDERDDKRNGGNVGNSAVAGDKRNHHNLNVGKQYNKLDNNNNNNNNKRSRDDNYDDELWLQYWKQKAKRMNNEKEITEIDDLVGSCFCAEPSAISGYNLGDDCNNN